MSDPAKILTNLKNSTAEVVTPNGLHFVIRPLDSRDSLNLGAYFLSLSETTRNWYGPHPFDQTTADRLCAAIDPAHTIRFIGTLPHEGQVVAYFILHLGVYQNEIKRYGRHKVKLNPQEDCLVAPSVADAYQNQGLGTLVMRHTIDVARHLGRRRMLLMGGVFIANQRAVHFYRKMGFQTLGTFAKPRRPDRPSYDMYLEIKDL